MADITATRPLAGTVALVTGASAGIGAATAVRLHAAGSRLLLVGRDRARLDEIAERTAGVTLPADLATPDGAAHVAAQALDIADRLDIVVHNAGVGWAGHLIDMPAARLEELLAVNVLGPLRLTSLLLPAMVRAGRGNLVFVTSIAGRVGVRDEAVYAATKGAVEMFAESLRYELGGSGVAVAVVVPGVVRTAFFERRGTPYARRWPRPISPERVANAILTAVVERRNDVVVPRWLTIPVRLRGVAPGIYRRLAGRFG